uniref:Carbamoyl phosphate synthase small chain n=1 Tax=Helminthocladia australis TaxID=260093 RepID=A0A1G4NT91_9FLOR|nr:Carbamoyl phosphate synthase small subunit [Helminthocladia australis]SCW21880.1 Carbamoyl phosphate synthase small subunit [Helminthocladia australis]
MFDVKAHKTILILEDGTKYYGWSFNKNTEAIGEIVFNTGMTGYQEVITDPSYSGQIITFTYPEIGNTGINDEDNESKKPFVSGIVAKNLCRAGSNWREKKSFIQYLQDNNIPHIYGIDTRSLTKHLRNSGAMNASISTQVEEINNIQNALEKHQNMLGTNMVQLVSSKKTYRLTKLQQYQPCYKKNNMHKQCRSREIHIVIVDFGIKYNILRNIQDLPANIEISIVPANTQSKDILALKPDGILLSNGPGDPSAVTYAISTVKDLITCKIPIFGICMGHQILSLALGLETFKLRFGHRGLNHPVGTKQNIYITSQNHGFAVDRTISKNATFVISETNYNDETLASIVHKTYPCFAVQYHPEASPGPRDTIYLFEHFIYVTDFMKNYPNFKHLT